MKKFTDVAFPRGNSKKRTKDSTKYENDDLFQTSASHGTNKKRKINKKSTESEKSDDPLVIVENPSYQIFSPGFKILGCVKVIKDVNVLVELPGGLIGAIPVTDVSQIYSDHLKESIADDKTDVPSLKDIFQVGQFIPCSVTAVGEDPVRMKKMITLSSDPRKVNDDLNLSLLRHNMLVTGAVKSIEDNGYEMDIGLKSVKAFMKNANIDDGRTLRIGQIVQCIVVLSGKKDPATKIISRIVNLSCKIDMVKASSVKPEMDVNIHALVPGMLVTCDVSKATKAGLLVKCLQYDGCIPKMSLRNSVLDSPFNYSINQTLSGRLLYIHPIVKSLYITLNTSIVNDFEASPLSLFPNHNIGDIITSASVTYTTPKSIYLKVDGAIPAFCKMSNLSDTKMTEITKEYHAGTVHKCRVSGFNLFSSLLNVILKKSLIDAPIFSASDLQISEKYECTVHSLNAAGVIVKLTSKLKGFIPNLHLSDVKLTLPEKHFPVGKKLHCRVLSASYSDRKSVILTNKSSLVKTQCTRITSYDMLQRGQITDGCIITVKTNYIIVAFYNNITGFISHRNTNLDKIDQVTSVFRKGQVVRCQVLNYNEEKRHINLTLKIRELNISSKEVHSHMGQIVQVRIEEKTHDGFKVSILPNETPAILPIKHLSDCLKLCSYLHDCFPVGTELETMLFRQKRSYIVSLKTSLIQSAKNEEYVNNLTDLNEGMLVHGVISSIVDYGVFVQISNKLAGLVPKKHLENSHLEDLDENSSYCLNQAVTAKVTSIDKERDRFGLSLKLRDVYSGDTSSSVDYLQSYLRDLSQILKHYQGLGDKKQAFSSLSIGSIVSIEVNKVLKSGFTGTVDFNVQCICTKEHFGDVTVKEGDKIQGIVLFMNIQDCSVQVSIVPSIVKRANDKVDNWHSKVVAGQKLKCDVIFSHDDYILVILRGHANGRVTFLPNKKHLNDNLGSKSLYSIFNVYPVTINSVLDGKIIATLDTHQSKSKSVTKSAEKRKADSSQSEESKRKRLDSTSSDISLDSSFANKIKKHELVLGKVYNAVIRSIKIFQMNILVDGKVPGRVHISEASDKIVEGQNPLDQFKVGQNIKVRIIQFREITKQNFLPITHKNVTQALPDCSTRQSVLEDENYQVCDPNDNICAGKDTIGYLKSYNNSCLWFKLNSKTDGKIYILNFSDNPKVLKDVDMLKPGAAYHAKVVSVEHDVVHLTRTSTQQVKEGGLVMGKVLSTRSFAGSLLRLPLGYRGHLDLTNISDEFKPAKSMLDDILSKLYVHCCLIEVNHQTKECIVSSRNSMIKRNFKKAVRDREVMDVSDLSVGDILRGFVTSITKKKVVVKLGRTLSGNISREDISKVNLSLELGALADVKVLSIDETPINIALQLVNVYADSENTTPSKPLKTSISKPSNVSSEDDEKDVGDGVGLGEKAGFIWNSDMSAIDNLVHDDSESDSDKEEEVIKKRKRRTAKSEREEEMNIHQREKLLLENNDNLPRDIDSFDRAVLSSPDSSIIWLQYMAYHLEQAEVDKARAVAERALRTISFREEQEKFNVWISLLNVENMYGTTETLREILQRALQHCDPLMVYNKLIGIYQASNKTDDAEALYGIMLKKYHQNHKIWIDCGCFLMKNDKLEQSRTLMQRALKSVDKKNHIETIAKFAQNEISHGDVERGKTMFENLLSTYSKRTDLWSVYIDLLINVGDIKVVRQVLDRALKLKLPSKKLKFFFKRYISLEEKYGSEESVEEIKARIVNFVEKS